jgi:predicted DNA-binding transcriptional regulator YafY
MYRSWGAYLTCIVRYAWDNRGVKASRLISLLLLLQNRGGMTAEELAVELEVSVRTVYRDVESLQLAGVPVYSDRGALGGYRLVDGYRTRLTGLTIEEADALFLAGIPGPAAELGLGSAVAAAQLKVLAALPTELSVRVANLKERFHLDAPNWFHGQESVPFLAVVASAVWEDRRLRVRYMRWKGETTRTISPLGLILKAGLWYLVAESANRVRIYRVARILSLIELDEHFERDPSFDLAAYWADGAKDFERTIFQDVAVLRLSPKGLTELGLRVSEPAARAALESAEDPGEKGWRRVRLPIVSIEDARVELLQLGAEAIVEKPVALRNAIVDAATSIQNLYV